MTTGPGLTLGIPGFSWADLHQPARLAELHARFMDGLAVRHPLMPDWEVTQEQAEALTAFVMSLGPGKKEDETQAARGFDLLQKNCSRCHAIDADSPSPNDKAPPFRDVVKKYDPDALEEALAALEEDHAFLLKGDVFTEDVIETWINWKREKEIDPMRLRPHPFEFSLYYDT